MSLLAELQDKYQRMRGSQETLQAQYTQAQANTVHLQQRFTGATNAVAMVQEAASRTQQRLEYHIGHLVTKGLQTIFSEAYEFKIEFVKKRGSTECELWLLKSGVRCDPMMQSGGGVCDVIAFVLRVALLAIAAERKGIRKLLVLDEPFRNVHGRDIQQRTAELVRLLADEYGLQILMVSDIHRINAAAHKLFTFSLDQNGTVVS